MIPQLRFPEFKDNGDWQKDSIDNQFDLQDGYPFSSFDFTKDKVDAMQVIRITDINNQNINEEKVYVLNSKIRELDISKYKVQNGDLLLSLTGAAGFNFFIWNTENGYINQRTMKISPKKQDNEALKFLLEPLIHSKINSIGTGQNNNLSKDALKDIKFPFPKPKEQQKLSSFTTNLNDLITAHSQKLDLLKDHKKGLMQNLFPQEGEKVPKYRFPEFNSPLVKIGFADLGDIKIGLTHKPEYISSGVPFLSSKNISNGYIDFINVQYISREKFESMPESTKPKLGDILFTRVGSNLGNPIVLEQDIEFGIFVSLGAFRVNKKANNFYMKYWMESDLFWKQVNQKVAGGAKDNLNSTWLREFELFIPSITEQQKIASCLSSLDALITAQAKKVEQLKLHKNGLMQGLFPKIND